MVLKLIYVTFIIELQVFVNSVFLGVRKYYSVICMGLPSFIYFLCEKSVLKSHID